ncbi:carbohydrate ABC transporter permease [Halegenticoccus tardaugens]|uniref:carbohydrate ABC transporter permease n=1 Tax=Halegenticoccus tardaugens TaxID=2071624 RepID=UPI00100BDBD7|nr:sugar ABC transporter permease [Halegenticoccus tardaugens]
MSTEQKGSGPLRESQRSGPYATAVRWLENLNETQFAYLLLLPVFFILGLIAIWPLLSTFEMSLHADSRATGGLGEIVGFQNYVDLLTGANSNLLRNPFLDLSQPLESALIVTFVFGIVTVLAETLIGFGQALVLDQDFRGRRWMRVVIIIPWAIPIAIQGMIFYLLFAPDIGFATPPLQNLGILSSQPFINTTDSLLIIVVADIWKTSAFMALLILAGLQSVDRSLYDVAKVAGATKWQQFKLITFPLVLPTVIVAMLFRTIDALRVYGLIETVAGCEVVPSLSCLVVTTYFDSNLIATASTVAFVTAGIIAVVVSIYIVKYAQEGV